MAKEEEEQKTWTSAELADCDIKANDATNAVIGKDQPRRSEG